MAKANPPRIPSVWGYGYDTVPSKVMIVEPAGTTATECTVIRTKKGWYFQAEPEHCGKSAIITRRDGEHDLVRLPVTPGTAFNCEDDD